MRQEQMSQQGSRPPKVTIGLPTFNGEAFLKECLQNISGQTFEDYVVLIHDNASTDNTANIVLGFSAADARFRYVRQKEHVSAPTNFADTLQRARSPLFIWRADDDLWAPDYLEKLVSLHDANPGCGLAVSRIIWERTDGTSREVFDYPNLPAGDIGRMRCLLQSKASWIYGLFDREVLAKVMAEVEAEYGEPWGADQLMLFYYGTGNMIAGTNDTYFIQRIQVQASARDAAAPAHRWKKDRSAIELMNYYAKMRGRFFRIAAGWIDEMTANPFRAMLWRAFLWHFMSRKLFKGRTVWRRKLRHRMTTVFRKA